MYRYNPEQQLIAAPRISFSSDFALEPPPPRRPVSCTAAADADFEFSPVRGRFPMTAADQLFCKGRILPLREATAGGGRPPAVTLRDELLRNHDGGGDRAGRRAPRWKELLGLGKAHKNVVAVRAGGASSAGDAHDLGEHGETWD
ncbi:hypothetical protein ACP4OV_017825 [Aristida adscensionis]